ncbi:MAG: TonB-dependent receptor [Candidatus Kapabacteria bacterium]|nr:TonB-dependent receptor [Ignavibacteriota bacterium]MCW5886143.1 TonB-dependent receptor [Candidatus Kapabacteria bacterium]
MKFLFTILLVLVIAGSTALAQGVTTGSITGRVTDDGNMPLKSATVTALHVPSGTTYGAITRADGRYTILGMRVGGPYRVVASFLGYAKKQYENISVTLGQTNELDFKLIESRIQTQDVIVYGKSDAVFNSDRTGAATSVSSDAIDALPTINRTIGDFTRLTPQSRGNSFAGQDNRLNNITVDGSYFNNSFGLGGQPGERTNVAPISIDAIEQIQVNIAPYDVRQGNFVGAGVNMVTKSGTNEYSGSVYFQNRTDALVGTKIGERDFDPGTFGFNMIGGRLGGPIIKNKLFFFANFEWEDDVRPGTNYKANDGTQEAGGNVTRVLRSDLDQLSSFLKQNFGYETGAYEGYDFGTPALRFILRLDYNLDEKNKFSLRYNHLNSKSDILLSNSSSLGFGTRRTTINSLNFQNSNYAILENIRSIIGEWNSVVNDNMTNNLIVGYRFHDESREAPGSLFPFVDILDGSQVYTSFGTEPFTPSNELRYSSFQIQNNFNWFLKDHTLLFGFSYERYESENIFFPGSQSAYVYNSLEDFYTDANDYLANPNRTTSPVNLRRFQYRYSNIPGQDKPVQPLKVNYMGFYVQDEWTVLNNFRLTGGIRVDIPMFEETGFRNEAAEQLVFKDEAGNNVQYRTDKLPEAAPLISPRLGFNWDLMGDKTTQLRGGTGVFTGQPAFVWISNQIGNNGVMTGFERLDGTDANPVNNRPFNPNPDAYKPASVTGEPASRYELALTDENFKFPQVWRTNFAVDQRMPWDVIGTAEFIYTQDVNGVYYINANLSDPSSNYAGPDNRERWTSGNRIHSNIDNAVVLKNQDIGYSWNIAASLEKSFEKGLYAKVGYAYGVAKNTVDPGSIAFGSWNNNQHSGNPNNPGLGYSAYTPDHRYFAAMSYKLDYFNVGSTTLSLFLDAYTGGRQSYVFAGDFNGDGGTSNDLIYVPKDQSEMNFQEYTASGVTFTAAEQANAWEAYINQDDYLSSRRGQYAERNGVKLPMVTRLDLSLSQEIYGEIFGKRNGIILRLDLFNFTNMLNPDWGVRQVLENNQPLLSQTALPDGTPQYRLRRINNEWIKNSFINGNSIFDVWRMQFTIRYMFN